VTAVRVLAEPELAGWDEHAVDVAGGHVLQSRAWAAHRASAGWRPRFVAVGDARAMVLVRPWPVIGGGSAYIPRGPVGPGTPWRTDAGLGDDGAGTDTNPAEGATVGEALASIASALADDGIDVLAADPEVAAADPGYERAIRGAGFRPIPEIQPSRHRMALRLPGDGDEDAVMGGIAKATRQRIRRAERDGVVVVRWDTVPTEAPGQQRATEGADEALGRFYGLLRATGDRRGFGFAGPDEFVTWWRRALEAGHLVYLEAREGAADGDVLGGLVLYRHGRRLSTAHSGDRAERRRDHPGAMHLLRWRAIQLALAEGRSEMDLGGVDVAGARREPVEGEPTFGLYEHKRSFGAEWVALAGAQERVARRWRYAAGRSMARATRFVGRAGGAS
jgi:lipid II:glycine glycyltransferase (peptidoglycan interpeptide bridge formation enzyme)